MAGQLFNNSSTAKLENGNYGMAKQKLCDEEKMAHKGDLGLKELHWTAAAAIQRVEFPWTNRE